MEQKSDKPGTFSFIGRVLAIIVIFLGLWLAYLDRLGVAGVFIATGFGLFFISHFQRIKVFKLLELEATLTDRIREVDETLEKLRAVTKLMSEASLRTASSLGRWDAVNSRRWMYNFAKRLTLLLQELSIPQAEINEILQPWRGTVPIDAGQETSMVLGHVSSAHIERISHDISLYMSDDEKRAHLQAEAKSLQEAQARMGGAFRTPALLLDRIEAFATELEPRATPEQKQAIDQVRAKLRNVRHFLDHGEFEDLELWLAGEQ